MAAGRIQASRACSAGKRERLYWRWRQKEEDFLARVLGSSRGEAGPQKLREMDQNRNSTAVKPTEVVKY